MSKTIANTYEIKEQIGAGGAGVVYLGYHLRLGKAVVLKADKRTLQTKPEVLRREVDALKNLSHTYIPQVYDFVSDDETVYTVMDYIEGESLDKPLKRGERFSQAQVIEWACELLEALCYLHSRPPHGILHGDLKPANVMLTPEGTIRLIDYNIALALGEHGAVRVGFSRGYASPEHYGVDDSVSNTSQSIPDLLTKLPDPGAETVLKSEERKKSTSYSSGKRQVTLDVRSDIYSLGATLYHLLTGVRPATKAAEVVPISTEQCSPAVIAIITKAMNPDPDLRYQTAAEMLYDFEHLYENDPRTRRQKRRCAVTAAVLTAVFLTGGALSLLGLKQMERSQATAKEQAVEAQVAAEAGQKEAEEAQRAAEEAEEAERLAKEQEQAEKEQERAAKEAAQAAQEAEQAAKEALEAVTNSEAAYAAGDVSAAIDYALEALALDSPYAAQAQLALTTALGVYDLADGYHAYGLLELPSEPLKLTLSPSGSRVAVLVTGEVLVYDTESLTLLAQLPAETSALADVVFVDESRLLYAGADALCAYDLDQQQMLWSGQPATAIALSGDGSTVAAVYKDAGSACIYDMATGTLTQTVDFGGLAQAVLANDTLADPKETLWVLNETGDLLASSFSNGALWVYDLKDLESSLILLDESDYSRFEGGFYGQYFAFSTYSQEESLFIVIDTEEAAQTGGFAGTTAYHVACEQDGIYVCTENILVKIDPVTGEQTEVAYTDAEIAQFLMSGAYTMTVTADNGIAFYDETASLLEQKSFDQTVDLAATAVNYVAVASSNAPTVQLLKLETHEDAQLFTYDADYGHSEARISADGETVMLFRYDQFRLYAMDGTILADVAIPDAAQVYDQQYRRDDQGSYLEVLYNDGLTRTYSAETGALLSETMGDAPDGTLTEEFETDHWKITAPLHGAASVYDRDTGELLWELQGEDYLTYVTQVGDYVITEYTTALGARYGLLLNEAGETLAELPNLCDILEDGTLVFDDTRGNLRESRIYSIQALQALVQ